MFIVYYWKMDNEIGEYLEHMIFDDYNNAKDFAKSNNSEVERII